MRLLLDTNIVISGLLWDGAPARMVDCVIGGKAELCSSVRLIAELARTLDKPVLAKRLAQRRQTAQSIVNTYANLCAIAEPLALEQRVAPDPDDDWVIATALAASADFIVTGDKPLL